MILATLERWRGVCKACRFEGTSRAYRRVMRRWSSWGRHYHTEGHLEACLEEFDQVRDLTVNADEVELALWFHDVVYRTWASDNEARSAALAADYKKDERVEKLRLPQTGVAIPERCRKESTVLAFILPIENTEPGHWELLIPDDAKWRATVPDWAKDRRQEIALRIGEAWKPKDFHLPNDLKGPDAGG